MQATTKKAPQWHATLVEAFREAKAAGVLAGRDEDDGGTCNFDSPAFRLERAREADIQAAAQEAGVDVASFSWFGGKRWYWVQGFLLGQGMRRSRMSHAATAVLRKYQEDQRIAGLSVCEYCQAD